MPPDDLSGFSRFASAHYGRPGFDDSRLLMPNFGEGRPEKLHVVKPHIGDHRHAGLSNVGGIQAASHAHFQHHETGSCLGEIMEARGRQKLKEARHLPQSLLLQQAFNRLADLGEGASKVVVADFSAVTRIRSFTRTRCGEV